MHDGSLLVAGVGGLGCLWARRAHEKCSEHADLLLVDADERSFEDARHAHCLPLGENSIEGCAALPQLAEAQYRRSTAIMQTILEPVELLVLLTALGGGAGSGAAPALAAQARRKGALVLTISALPFEDQPVRNEISLSRYWSSQRPLTTAITRMRPSRPSECLAPKITWASG